MIDQFYLDEWPILKDGWQEFDHKPFGGTWFYKVLPSRPDMFARVYLFVGNNWHRIGLEVRHQSHGYANIKNIGVDGSCSPSELNAAISAHLPILVAIVQAQYEAWSKSIDEEYKL